MRVQSNKVKETSEAKIKDFVLDYLLENGEIEVYKYCANYQNLFSESFLLLLETIELMLLKTPFFITDNIVSFQLITSHNH